MIVEPDATREAALYKTLSAEAFRKQLDLELDYEVEGFMVYGGWKQEIYEEVLGFIADMDTPPLTRRLAKDYLSPILEITANGKRFWFVVSYGGALLSEFVHLACLFGSKRNLVVGSCGGLHPEAVAGDLVIPTHSYADESSARGYATASNHQHLFDYSLSRQVRARFESDYTVWNGPTITHQAMLSETWEDVQRWSEQGYSGVEMEAGTVAAVSNHFGVPSAAALRISDNLIRQETVFTTDYQKHRSDRRLRRAEMIRIVLSELLVS